MKKYEDCAREILADNIKYNRKLKKMSQEELAEALDTTPVYISNIETCKKNVGIDFIGKIADILEISIDKLFIDKIND